MASTAIYTRISSDRVGDAAGVRRQRVDCEKLCTERGWDVSHVYQDNDISAYSGAHRPGYQQLCEDIDARTIRRLVVWHPDRLHRSPRELEDFIDLVERTGCEIVTVTAGDWDLSTADGRMTARIIGTVARKESEDKSRRLRRKHEELAEQGRLGGGDRPFGYLDDRVTPDPVQAVWYRRLVDGFLAGDSLIGLAAMLNDAGIPTGRGAGWSRHTVRQVLRNPRYAGLRAHRGKVVGEAVWPALVDRDVWGEVQARLDSRRTSSRPRRWLMTGVLVCGKCGDRMAARPAYKTNPHDVYYCRSGDLSVHVAPLEELVVRAIRVRLSDPLPEVEVDAGATEKLVAAEARLAELSRAYFVDSSISEVEYRAARGPLSSLADDLRRMLAVPDVQVPDVSAGWDGLPVARQVEIVHLLVERVTVLPVGRTGRAFQPDRVVVDWRA